MDRLPYMQLKVARPIKPHRLAPDQLNLLTRFALAVLGPALTVGLVLLFRPVFEDSPFLLVWIGIAVATWFGGFIEGIVAAAVALALLSYFIYAPNNTIVLDVAFIARAAVLVLSVIVAGLARKRYLQAYNALRESEWRWAITLESIGDAVIATDTDGRITFMNSVAEQMTGWTRQQATQQPVGEVFHIINETTRQPVESPANKVLKTGRVVGLANHTLLVRKDGLELAIDDSGAPIKGEAGETIGVVLVFRDVTAHRKMEYTLQQSEERFQLALKNSPIVMFTQDRDLRYTWIQNPYGRSAEEILGKTDEDLVPPEQAVFLNRIKRQVIETGVGARAESSLTVNGQQVVHDFTVEPVRDTSGAVIGISCVGLDITERKAAEQERERLLQAEASARQQAEDWAARLSYLNTFTTAVAMGLRRDEVSRIILSHVRIALGASTALLYLLSDDGTTLRLLRSEGYPETVTHQRELLSVHDSPAPLALAVRQHLSEWIGLPEQNLAAVDPVTGAPTDPAGQTWVAIPFTFGGRVVGGIELNFASARDFDTGTRDYMRTLADQCALSLERARLFESEAAARQEAERQNRLRVQFMGMISHELRTPLTSIKGFATTLLADDVIWDPVQQRDFIATINDEADKLTDLISQLLDLSRIEAGGLRVEPAPQSLTSILDAARAQLDVLCKAHALRVAIPDDLPCVQADVQRISQVLTNLVGNAAKYSSNGTTITISAACESTQMLRVRVTDEGPGIAPEDRPHVFEAFRRGEGSAARQTKGAGLGLAICKGIIEAHGGRIWIEDRNGPGATIAFTLPAAS